MISKIFRSELYKLIRSKSFLWLFLCLLVMTIAMNSISQKGQVSDKDADSTFAHFVIAMNDPSAVGWSSLFFAAIFIGKDLKQRTVNQAIYKGAGRISYFLLKTVIYYTVALIVLLACILAILFRFAPSFAYELPTDYVIRSLGIRMILDIGTMSLPLIFVAVFKDVFKTISATFLYTLLFNSNRAIINLHSYLPKTYNNEALWALNPDWQRIWPSIGVSGLFVVFSITLSSMLFRKTQLK